MSYEGYRQKICVNLHYTRHPETYGCEPDKCMVCNTKKFVWSNEVDDTNCDQVGIVQESNIFELLGKSPDGQSVLRAPTEEDRALLQSLRGYTVWRMETDTIEFAGYLK